MSMHIGNLIRKRLEEIGMTKSEFGRRINTSPQNVYGILRRRSIDTQLLHRISQVLNYDFFNVITGGSPGVNDPEGGYPGDMTSERDQLIKDYKESLKVIDQLRKENELLKEINTLLRERMEKGSE